jgi:protein-L-isoaspartate(D-aspartate) O-methyltransferase
MRNFTWQFIFLMALLFIIYNAMPLSVYGCDNSNIKGRIDNQNHDVKPGSNENKSEENPSDKDDVPGKVEETKKEPRKKSLKEYPRKDERFEMVKKQIEKRDIDDEEVLKAMRYVPRHLFIPELSRNQAYRDNPVPIGYGQTISQPYIVALMTDLLELDEKSKALEIGTGSGYQAAILAEIVEDVYSIEIVKELYKSSTSTLQSLGYDNIKTKHADGFHGWEENAPFDAIIVTAAADHIPPPLLEQLKIGGRMIIPVGMPHQIQRLVLVDKIEEGKITTNVVASVRFVPLTRMSEK